MQKDSKKRTYVKARLTAVNEWYTGFVNKCYDISSNLFINHSLKPNLWYLNHKELELYKDCRTNDEKFWQLILVNFVLFIN